MRTIPLARIVAAGVASLCACAAPKPVPVQSAALGQVGPFDLLPRGFDDNGLGLNPELGWHYNRRCNRGGPAAQDSNPAKCSWRFINDGTQPIANRPVCNTYMMDPDFSTFVLSRLSITCSDSPLRFPGHVNWSARYGGAATYEGWLTWEGYSGALPAGDFDFNFVLTLNDEHSLGNQMGNDWDWIGIEFDSREVPGFASPWWSGLTQKVHTAPLEVDEYVGRKYAIVTGLLGIDAEHLSARNPGVELHPAYSIAVRVDTVKSGALRKERWAIFARDRGNEGLCSNWDRVHVLPLLDGAHVVRLPWKKGMTDVKLGADTTFCSSGEGTPTVTISYDDKHHGVLVRFDLSPGAIVDGDLRLEWTGAAATPDVTAEPTKAMKRRPPTRELENPEVVEQTLAHVRSDPKEREAFEAASRPPPCKPVPVRVIKAAVPERPSKKSECQSPSPPVSEARARLLGFGGEERVSGAPTQAPATVSGATQRAPRTPREKYCAERAGKSAVAARFCAQGEGD